MAKNTKIHFYLKDTNGDSSQLVYIRFYFIKPIKISTGKSIIPKMWNNESERCYTGTMFTRVQNQYAKKLNSFLDYLNSQISSFLKDHAEWKLQKENENQIINSIKQIIKSYINQYKNQQKEEIAQKEITPSAYFEDYIENMSKRVIRRTGTFTNPKTKGHHKIVLKRFREFLLKTKTIDNFSVFDKNFEGKFEVWAYQNEDYSPNTVAATFSVIKVWLNKAEEEGLITDKSFHSWKSKGNDVVHIYLTIDEIKDIYVIKFTEEILQEYKIDSKSNIEQSRDLFVLACNLGIRLSDWHILSDSQWDFKENVVIINTSKTQEPVEIPISPIVKKLYKKYNGKFPRPVDKSHLNKHIQKCAEIAGINDDIYMIERKGGIVKQVHYKKYQLVTTHTGRRSFATNLFLECHNSKMVMSFTGHKTEANFFKYICVNKKEVAKLSQEYFKKMWGSRHLGFDYFPPDGNHMFPKLIPITEEGYE
ncbi:MAG: phage integrase SAM-like domain-containing protein [Dysgonomonas sp.]|nr:phage integrase SAM-like domain-containing protein [Dysgonomonas sp.]